jgi:hypothetical protein
MSTENKRIKPEVSEESVRKRERERVGDTNQQERDERLRWFPFVVDQSHLTVPHNDRPETDDGLVYEK